MVCEMRHPRGLNFANERKVWHLRVQKNMSWESIAAEVVNLQGAPSTADLVKRAYNKFNGAAGRSVYKFARCGRERWKITIGVQHFILAKLLQLRMTQVCTSTTLQAVLAKEKGVNVSDATIRKFLRRKGYRWLPRAQKLAYSAMDKQLRFRFCKQRCDYLRSSWTRSCRCRWTASYSPSRRMMRLSGRMCVAMARHTCTGG